MKTILVLILNTLLILTLTGCNLLDKKETVQTTNEVAKTSPSPTVKTENSPTQTPGSNSENKKKNLLAMGNGAFVINTTSEYDRTWQANNIIDEFPQHGWATDKNKVTNESITIEFPAKTTLKTLVFDTVQVDTEGSAAKDISVEISDTSATAGFREILAVTLKDKQAGQEFPVKEEIGGQWLRVNVKNNYGSPEYVEIMEMRGFGEQEMSAPLQNISGTYETNYGKFRIKQEGTSVVGCYEHDEGIIEGGIEDRLLKLTWKESGGADDQGPAMMFFSKDGKEFLGVWNTESFEKGSNGEWNGKKISNEVGSCEHYKNLSGNNAAGNKIKDELEKSGRASVYGINFDFNSDKIKDESKQTLDQIVKILKDNAAWKMTVEGHTDNIGGESFNQTLSEKRANAVKKYLTDAGIEESRLTAKGLGMSKSIAENDTESGRARNRRVELVKE